MPKGRHGLPSRELLLFNFGHLNTSTSLTFFLHHCLHFVDAVGVKTLVSVGARSVSHELDAEDQLGVVFLRSGRLSTVRSRDKTLN